MNNKEIYNYLKSNNFELKEQIEFEYFRDYLCKFTAINLELIFTSSRDFEGIDIKRINSKEKEIFDLALVKALILNEKKLNDVTQIDELIDFLQKNLLEITNLFEKKNYKQTKKKLKNLQNIRVKQMFPQLRKNKI